MDELLGMDVRLLALIARQAVLAKKEALRDMATAVRAGMAADEHAFQRFLHDLFDEIRIGITHLGGAIFGAILAVFFFITFRPVAGKEFRMCTLKHLRTLRILFPESIVITLSLIHI